MNRPLILATVGGLIVAVALALTFFVEEGGKPDSVAMLRSQPPKPAGAPPSDRRPDAVARADTAAPGAAGGSSAAIRPSFDVVRVNPRGDAVIAGRAAPNAEIVVRDGDREVGKAKADSRGEWVLVPKEPLATGSRELTLSARSRGAEPSPSDRNVVIVVPEREKKETAGANSSPVGPLAVLVPREGGGESVVLQRPGDGEINVGEAAAKNEIGRAHV